MKKHFYPAGMNRSADASVPKAQLSATDEADHFQIKFSLSHISLKDDALSDT